MSKSIKSIVATMFIAAAVLAPVTANAQISGDPYTVWIPNFRVQPVNVALGQYNYCPLSAKSGSIIMPASPTTGRPAPRVATCTGADSRSAWVDVKTITGSDQGIPLVYYRITKDVQYPAYIVTLKIKK